MALDEAARARVRFHLGYYNITHGFALSQGVLQRTQLSASLEANFDQLDVYGESFVRECVLELDCLLNLRRQVTSSIEIESNGAVKLRGAPANAEIEVQMRDWGARLGDVMGSYPNPLSVRNNLASGSGVSEPTGM
jgi:hypothetical protein